MILKVSRNCIIMKDAFRMIPIALQHHGLMRFIWNSKFYAEQVLSFGLPTAPIISTLRQSLGIDRKVATNWVLSRRHDGSIPEFTEKSAHPIQKRLFPALRCTGILRNDDKDTEGTAIKFLDT